MSSSRVVLAIATVVALAAPVAAQPVPVPRVRVDQVGYPLGRLNIALVTGDTDATEANIRERSTGRLLLTVPLGPPVTDPQSGDTVRRVDVSAVLVRGYYVIEVPGVGSSDPFKMDRDVYGRALYLAMRSFYGQRCGTRVDLAPDYPGFSHEACHPTDAAFHPSTGKTGRIRATRGWHDAGDYGKYVVNSGITTGQLLWAWEWYPQVFRDLPLDIPESSNTTPDILDEVRWNLDWLLTMQDTDGGVWPKLTSETFGSFVMPDKDDGGLRYIIGAKSSCATADFAAVMAIAGRTYRGVDNDFASTALAAARKAFTWAEANPEVYFKNPQGVSTGEYGDGRCTDERLWAAAELFRTTGDAQYDEAARALAAAFHVSADDPPSWANVGTLGLWAYALGQGGDASLKDRVRAETLDAAAQVAVRTDARGWRHALNDRDFVWGSNGVAANYGVLLLAADRFDRRPAYVGAALEQLHYLLGRNTFGTSWVTGVGARPFKHPHHRPSGGDQNEDPWPGLLSGGPIARPADATMAKLAPYPPARGYVDEESAYSANENAINWNSALVLLLAGVHGR
jgi:endoglucanase